MADFANGKIQAFVGPRELGAPDNLEEVIVNFIKGAKKTLDIAVQELDSIKIAQALLDAKWDGISIRMFLEQDYLADGELPKLEIRDNETQETAVNRIQWTEDRKEDKLKYNREILTALLRNNIDVKADYNPAIFHQKFIIRDYRGKSLASSAVLTGSTNFTYTGTHRNLNHIVIFNSGKICKFYSSEFEEIREGTFGSMQERRRKPIGSTNLKGVPVRIRFAPDDYPELEVVKQMLKCKNRLDFAIFTFSGASGIDDTMIMLRNAKRKIKGVLDRGQGKQTWAATTWLHNEGIKVRFPKPNPDLGKLHHKLMVVDDAIVIGGSMNYTPAANEANDENIFVLGSPYPDLKPKDGGPVDVQECAKLANYFRDEIERIYNDGENFVSA